LIIVGGICVLVVLAALVQRASRLRGNTTTTLPTSYSLPPSLSSSMQQRSANEQYLPPTPRFEPIITGKLVLAGMMLMFLLGGIGLLLLWMI
jgi:hypothetical protein